MSPAALTPAQREFIAHHAVPGLPVTLWRFKDAEGRTCPRGEAVEVMAERRSASGRTGVCRHLDIAEFAAIEDLFLATAGAFTLRAAGRRALEAPGEAVG